MPGGSELQFSGIEIDRPQFADLPLEIRANRLQDPRWNLRCGGAFHEHLAHRGLHPAPAFGSFTFRDVANHAREKMLVIRHELAE